MRNPWNQAHLRFGLLALCLAAQGWSPPAWSQKPSSFATCSTMFAARLTLDFIRKLHVRPPQNHGEFGLKILDRWFAELDPHREFLLATDVGRLQGMPSKVYSELFWEEYDTVESILRLVRQRTRGRLAKLETWATADYDFSESEYFESDGSAIPFAATRAEAEERSRRRIKYQRLLLAESRPELSVDEQKQEALKILQRQTKDFLEASDDEMAGRLINSIASAADPHTHFFSPEAAEEFRASMELKFVGIGAQVGIDEALHPIVKELLPGGPAAKSGLFRSGDWIEAVDDTGSGTDWCSTDPFSLREVVRKIQGPKGSKVGIRLRRPGDPQPIEVFLERDIIRTSELRAEGRLYDLEANGVWPAAKIAVLHLRSFYGGKVFPRPGRRGPPRPGRILAKRDVRRILKSSEFQNADLVMVDLRLNEGGLLDAAVEISGDFLGSGPVVQVYKEDDLDLRSNDRTEPVCSAPLMVVVDGASASASEIFAAAIQDYRRGLVVGHRTYGKGSVQGLGQIKFPGPARSLELKQGLIKVTREMFYRVRGDSTQHAGVTPDIVLPSLTSALVPRESDLPNALTAPPLAPAATVPFGSVTQSTIVRLQKATEARQAADPRFSRLREGSQHILALKSATRIPLRRAEFEADDPQKYIDLAGADRKPLTKTVVGGPDDFYNNELFNIARDYLKALAD